MATAPGKTLDIGRVLSQGFGVLGKNAIPFFLLALVLAGLPAAVLQYWMLSIVGTRPTPEMMLSMTFWWPVIGGILVGFLTASMLQAVLIGATVQQLGGRPVDLGRDVGNALARLLPVILLSILMGLCIVLGLLALIVPGVIIYLALIVAIPVMIAEDRGIMASMSRSRHLTSGLRWMVLLLVFVMTLFNSALSPLCNAIFSKLSDALGPTVPSLYVLSAGAAVGGALTSMVGAVLTASLYLELRRIKEGATAESLAGVFG